jgi:hypothetical protein
MWASIWCTGYKEEGLMLKSMKPAGKRKAMAAMHPPVTISPPPAKPLPFAFG